MRAEFLAEVLGEEGFVEIRAWKTGREKPLVAQEWFRLEGGVGLLGASHKATELDAKGWDVYYGVLPRTHAAGTAEACPSKTSVLWADIDGKRFPSKDVALFTLNRFPITPQLLVDSGHGFHAYWLLDEPEEFARAANAMRGIAKTVGGDNVNDAARVLRVPGTHNYKGDPVPVRLLRFDVVRRYRFGDFDEWEYLGQPEQRIPAAVRMGVRVEIGQLPDWLRDLIQQGAPRGARSEAAFKACVWLMRYGWSEDDIRLVFESTPDGIGQKYHERRDGPRWLDVTLRAARAAA